MMNCSEAKELIQIYMDNELDARNTLEVQHHLDACSGCQNLLDYFIKQDQTLQTFVKSQIQDTASLREAILSEIRREPVSSDSTQIASIKRWLQSTTFRRIAAVLVIA